MLDSLFLGVLDEILEGIASETFLNQSWITWNRKRGADNLGSFNDFVFGNLNGSIVSLYSSYNGIKIMELMDDEYEELRKMLLSRYSGLENKVEQFQERKNKG